MKILLSGGGTLGPVTPLIAIAESYKEKNLSTKFVWIGTKKGVEKRIVEQSSIPFYPITCGKWRRYFSLLNFLDIFRVIIGFFQAFFILKKEKPDLLISAGGFVSVPVHLAGFLLKIPSWVHQQDVKLGLANKIMGRCASKVTVSTQFCVDCFDYKDAEFIGNPVRSLQKRNPEEAKKFFNISDNEPVIFVLGGGTGSKNINLATAKAVKMLPKTWHFIHLTGNFRAVDEENEAKKFNLNYKPYKFFTKEIENAYSVADVVVTRGGFGTLTEMANFKKAGIVVSMQNTHQELNAKMVSDNGAGVALIDDENLAEELAGTLKNLMDNPEVRKEMGERLSQILPITRQEKIISIINSFKKV